MLRFGRKEKLILDTLLKAEPKRAAKILGIPVSRIYTTKAYFRRKVQNGQEFLLVSRTKYKPLLKRRLKTPAILPDEEDEEFHDDDFDRDIPETGLIPLKPRKKIRKVTKMFQGNDQEEDFKPKSEREKLKEVAEVIKLYEKKKQPEDFQEQG